MLSRSELTDPKETRERLAQWASISQLLSSGTAAVALAFAVFGPDTSRSASLFFAGFFALAGLFDRYWHGAHRAAAEELQRRIEVFDDTTPQGEDERVVER